MTLEEYEALPIQAKLRAPAYWMSGSGEGHEGENDLPFKAADEIDRLQAEIARMKAPPKLKVSDITEADRRALAKPVSDGGLSLLGQYPNGFPR